MTDPHIDFSAFEVPPARAALTDEILAATARRPPQRAPARRWVAVVAAAALVLVVGGLTLAATRGGPTGGDRDGQPRSAAVAGGDVRAGDDTVAARRDYRPEAARRLPLSTSLDQFESRDARERLLGDLARARAAGAPAPALRTAATGDGDAPLSIRELQESMQEVRPLIVECLEMARERNPSAAGRLGVTMHLVGCAEVGGLVADVTLTPSDGVDLSEELDECLTQTLLSLRLPASFVSGEMEVPLVFRVGGDRSSGPVPGDRPVYRVPGPPGGDELVDGAREALQRGDFEEALSLCGAALARQPDDQHALTVCVIAACNAGDGDRALRHATAITAPERVAMLREICLRHGVELAGP